VTTLVLRGIGELCTCDPRRGPPPGVVRNAAVLAEDGIVTFAGPEAGLPRIAAGEVTDEIDCAGAAVIPGFVDAHTHLVWLGDRSGDYAARAAGATYEGIAASGGGIASTARATSGGTEEELVAAARQRARAMLAQGTTTVEVKSGYGLGHDAEMRMLDAARALQVDPDMPDVVTTYMPLHARSAEPAYIDDVCTRGVAAAEPRARFVDAFCERGAYSVAECQRLFVAAAAHGLRVKVHAEQRSRSGGARLAARVGAVSADHLEHASDSDLRALAAAGVNCVILPGAALMLGGPPPPGRRALDAGARLAVATDCNPGTCYSESMPLMLSLSVALAGLTPAEALVAATAGGAHALEMRDRGAISEGRRCDLVVLNSRAWIDVAYHLGGDVVRDVVLGGRLVRGR